VCTQLTHTFIWHILWHRKDCSVIHPHCFVDMPEVSLNGSSDEAKITDNASSLIRFQSVINFHLRSFMLVFKYMPGNTDQIGRLRNQLAGAIFVYDFILIGESSTNSLLAFQMNLPLSFVMF